MVSRALVLVISRESHWLNIRSYRSIWVGFGADDDDILLHSRDCSILLLLPEGIINDRIGGLWNGHGSLLLSNSILFVTDLRVPVFLFCQIFAALVLRLNFFLFNVSIGCGCRVKL